MLATRGLVFVALREPVPTESAERVLHDPTPLLDLERGLPGHDLLHPRAFATTRSAEIVAREDFVSAHTDLS